MPIYSNLGRLLMEIIRMNKKEFLIDDIVEVYPANKSTLKVMVYNLKMYGFISAKIFHHPNMKQARPNNLYFFTKGNIARIKAVFNTALVEEGIILPEGD